MDNGVVTGRWRDFLGVERVPRPRETLRSTVGKGPAGAGREWARQGDDVVVDEVKRLERPRKAPEEVAQETEDVQVQTDKGCPQWVETQDLRHEKVDRVVPESTEV